MSKNKNQETAASETTEIPETDMPTMETPAAETKAKPGKAKPGNFVCPACKHTAGVNIGAPYMNGEQKLQLVKCVKCHHVMTVLLS